MKSKKLSDSEEELDQLKSGQFDSYDDIEDRLDNEKIRDQKQRKLLSHDPKYREDKEKYLEIQKRHEKHRKYRRKSSEVLLEEEEVPEVSIHSNPKKEN